MEQVIDVVDEQAGVSVRTVLRHFGSRRELLDAAGRREADPVRRQRATAAPGDLPAAVRGLVDHYEEMGTRVLRLLGEEQRVPSLGAVVETGRVTHLDWCRRVFADALAPLEGVAHDRCLAQLVAGCDVYTWLLRRDAGLSRRETSRALVELLEPVAGLRS